MTRNFGVHAQKKRAYPPKTLNTAMQRKYGTGLPTTTNNLPSMRNGGDCQVRRDAGDESVTGAVTIASSATRMHPVATTGTRIFCSAPKKSKALLGVSSMESLSGIAPEGLFPTGQRHGSRSSWHCGSFLLPAVVAKYRDGWNGHHRLRPRSRHSPVACLLSGKA